MRLSSLSFKLTTCLLVLIAVLFYTEEYHRLGSTTHKFYFSNAEQAKQFINSLRSANNQTDGDSPKTILLWTSFFGEKNYYGVSSIKDLGCQVDSCVITYDREAFNRSDAILFHFIDTRLNDLPSFRFTNQRFVFVYFEAPAGQQGEILKVPANYFNWTMNYRKDSDLVRSYGGVYPRPFNGTEDFLTIMSLIAGKKKLVAWFVSNCHSTSKREIYVKQLAQHIPVDIYGSCGNATCTGRGLVCDSMLRSDYKFYLAFENNICHEYVTEKFFRALEYDVVPIVFGGADYRDVAPPHSYIDVSDFKSPRELADYLLLLDSNDKLYSGYFDWKRDYFADQIKTKAWCQLCAKLHDPTLPSKTYENISAWYLDSSQCVHPPDRFFNQVIGELNT